MKRFSIAFICLLATLAVTAQKISEQQALEKARLFMPDKYFSELQQARRRAKGLSDDHFYVFNAADKGGFVIISDDDRTPPVIGYADSGELNLDCLPDNVRAWLDGYNLQIQSLGSIKRVPRRTGTVGDAIPELIKTKWGQGYPYNLQCPERADNNGSIQNCVTGCVATSIAQVLNYYQYPGQIHALAGYTTNDGFDVPALEATTIDWSKMKLIHSDMDTEEAANEVAKLMRYCGQAVFMNYGLRSSGAVSYASDFVDHFGFSNTVQQLTRSDFSNSQWESIIYQELSEGRPVIYNGQSSSAAHQFICDGYDNDGLFHINWGWNGQCDGYFLLTLCDPEILGTGGGTSTDGFKMNQHAFVGLQPAGTNESPYAEISATLGELGTTSFSRTDMTDDFMITGLSVSFSWSYRNPSFDYGFGLYLGNRLIKSFNCGSFESGSSPVIVDNASIAFGEGLADGNYCLYPIYRNSGVERWKLCENADEFYFVNISGTSLTLRKPDFGTYNVTVNSVHFPEVMKRGKITEAVFNLTNNGDTYDEPLCLSMDGIEPVFTCAYIDPGQTGDVRIPFVPHAGGELDVELAVGNTPIYSGTVNVMDTVHIITNIEGRELAFSVTEANHEAEFLGAMDYIQGAFHLPSSVGEYTVTGIGQSAFYFEENMTELYIPATIRYIENEDNVTFYTFWNMQGLEKIVVDEANPYFDSRNNCNAIIEKANGKLHRGCKNTLIPEGVKIIGAAAFSHDKEFVIGSNLPDGVTEVGPYGFYAVGHENDVVFPASLKKVGKFSMSNMNRIVNVVFPEGTTHIGKYAFDQNRSLTTLILPKKMACLDEDAFCGSAWLRLITSPSTTPPVIDMNVFASNFLSSQKPWGVVYDHAVLYVPEEAVDLYKSTPSWSLFKNVSTISDKGDVNGDKVVDSKDVSDLVDYLAFKSDRLPCQGGDLDLDGWIDVHDLYNLVEMRKGNATSPYVMANADVISPYQPISLENGTTITPTKPGVVNVYLNNADFKATVVNCTAIIPDGIELVQQADGHYLTLTDRVSDDFTLVDQYDGKLLHILLYRNTNGFIDAVEEWSPIMSFQIKLKDGANPEVDENGAMIENIDFVDDSETTAITEGLDKLVTGRDRRGNLTIDDQGRAWVTYGSYTFIHIKDDTVFGDITGDKIVDDNDIEVFAERVVNHNYDGLSYEVADIDKDNYLDAFDFFNTVEIASGRQAVASFTQDETDLQKAFQLNLRTYLTPTKPATVEIQLANSEYKVAFVYWSLMFPESVEPKKQSDGSYVSMTDRMKGKFQLRECFKDGALRVVAWRTGTDYVDKNTKHVYFTDPETGEDYYEADWNPIMTIQVGLKEGAQPVCSEKGQFGSLQFYTDSPKYQFCIDEQGKAHCTDYRHSFLYLKDDLPTLTFNAGQQWQTFYHSESCIPKAGSHAKVYEVTRITNQNVYVEQITEGVPDNIMVLVGLDEMPNTTTNVELDYSEFENYHSSLLSGDGNEATGLAPYSTYVLFNNEFVLNSATTVPAGKGYILANSIEHTANARPRLSIVIGGEATPIQEVDADKEDHTILYDLQGRRLNGQVTKKGLYIKKGKKLVVK